MSGRTFIFAGGGTGGHLYPALAIAQALRALEPESRSLFLCSTRAIDAEILGAEGVAFTPIPAAPFGTRPRALLRFLRAWPRAVRAAQRAMESCEGSRVRVVAMGGFVAAPAVAAARRVGAPVALVNLDAAPGKANKVIARRADLTLTTPAPLAPSSWERITPIVRGDAMASGSAEACREALGLDASLPTLFVSGGSQGARSINELMIVLAEDHPEIFRGWQVFHQTGVREDERVERAYESAGVRARVVPFVREIGRAWGAADLALARCGAGTVAEVWCSHTPTVFLPYPYHRDEHQRHNAEVLLAHEGDAPVIIEKDRIDPAVNAGVIGPILGSIMGAPERRRSMKTAFGKLGKPHGAHEAAVRLLSL
ncbi:MAG: glycosyltransferase [Phycisphaerales bacterium]